MIVSFYEDVTIDRIYLKKQCTLYGAIIIYFRETVLKIISKYWNYWKKNSCATLKDFQI